MQFPTLYKRTSTGSIQQWTIRVIGNTYVTESGKVGGKITQSLPTVCVGKNDGKTNATTDEEQAAVEAQAKYDKQLKSKYKTDINQVDTINFISPTLASPLKKRTKPLVFPAAIQVKYNGVCCIIDKEFGSRTRTGEIFYNIRHINAELKSFFDENPDVVLHGELYNYDLRENLNQLIELVAVTRKDKDITIPLMMDSEQVVRYYVYDGYVKGKESEPYHKRIKMLHELIVAHKLKYVIPAPTTIVEDEEAVADFFERSVADKQEGAILRMLNMPYVHKRTTDILKYKVSETAEFLCTGFLEGTGNWTGIAKKAVMLLPNGKTFNCNMKGTQAFLREVWNNPQKYVHKYYITDFQNYSEYGIPQIAYTGLEERKIS
jgi:ATP-dependent DNA ligase